MTIILLISWLVTSVLSYGAMFAYFQREFPTFAKEYYWANLRLSLLSFFPIAGPAAGLFFIAASGFKGFKFY